MASYSRGPGLIPGQSV